MNYMNVYTDRTVGTTLEDTLYDNKPTWCVGSPAAAFLLDNPH